MTLYYRQEHLACTLYAKDENRIFYLMEYRRNEVVRRRYLELTLLVFVLEGRLEIGYGVNRKMCVDSGSFFILPKNFDVSLRSLDDTRCVLCSFSSDITLCSRFSLCQLEKDMPVAADNTVVRSLVMDDRIKVFMPLLYDCLAEGLGCVHFHKLKRDELFLYLRAGYSKEELALFFRPVLGGNIEFKDFILANYKSVHDVAELASKANMSLSTFNRRFKESFRESAYKWLLARKSESILYDIIKSNLSFSEISDKYHFSSPSYFAAFCKKQFGKTAVELRKNGGGINS